MAAIFVSGIGTGVGKTFFSSLYLAKYGKKNKIHYWKPVETGPTIDSDFELVKNSVPLPSNYFIPPVSRFAFPASPHYSAKLENSEVDLKTLEKKFEKYSEENILIEGAGGLLVPLTENLLYLDFVKKYNISIVLVTYSGLGTINHTLLSIEAMKARKVHCYGFYMIGAWNNLSINNSETIEKLSEIPFLGNIDFPGYRLTKNSLVAYSIDNFDPEGKLEILF
ncbi:MAG: dethiobiotin synthase [Leptospiraceae bacterium]|nr:dethiobiotin synthase [Leptospiraceae bacterium]